MDSARKRCKERVWIVRILPKRIHTQKVCVLTVNTSLGYHEELRELATRDEHCRIAAKYMLAATSRAEPEITSCPVQLTVPA